MHFLMQTNLANADQPRSIFYFSSNVILTEAVEAVESNLWNWWRIVLPARQGPYGSLLSR